MKKFKIIGSIVFQTIIYTIANAQVVALCHRAPHCIFLKSDQDIYITLIYYNNDGKELINIKRNTGYSIEDHLSKDDKGKLLMKLKFYKISSEDSFAPMTVNLYFGKMLDTINYYLSIPKFKAGTNINVAVPSSLQKKVNEDICCKGLPVISSDTGISWQPVPAYDLTNIVFPQKKEKNK